MNEKQGLLDSQSAMDLLSEVTQENTHLFRGNYTTPSRWNYWWIVQEANHLISEHTESDSHLRFIDLTDQLLGPDGKPDRRLYRFDRLHPNKRGYAKWIAVIKPLLMADLL